MVNKIMGFLETKTNDGEPYSAYKKSQSKESFCHDRQQRRAKNNLMNEFVKTVIADQNGIVAISKNKMDSRSHDNAIMQREGITIECSEKIKQEPQKTKEFSQKHFYNTETKSGESDPACKSIFNPQFGLECKRIIVDAGDVLDLSLSQSIQRIDAEGTSEKVNILNTETISYNSSRKVINDIEKEQKALDLKDDKARFQCPEGNDFNLDDNNAIDLSLIKYKQEVVEDTAIEEIENTSHSSASWQTNVKESLAIRVAVKTELEETQGHNQYSKEIQSKYEHNAVSLFENPLALQRKFKCVKRSSTKSPLKENSIALNELIIKSENSNSPQDNNQEDFTQTNLYNNSYKRDLNTSLDVNIDTLSNANSDNKDLNDEPSNHSHFSLNKTSSEESKDESSFLKRNSLTEKKKKMKSKGNPSRILRKHYKTRQKTSRSNTNLKEPICKTSKGGRKPKTKQTSNCIEKDSSFIKRFLIKKKMKNLPKTRTIETRIKKKNNKRIAAKEKFPKPTKLENVTLKLHSIDTELPKPTMFKQEHQTDSRNIELYQQPAFQPFIRLKRLNSENLLIPLKTKRIRKSRSEDTSLTVRRLNNCSQTNNDDSKDLIIHQAFSLNPQIKLKKINGGHDHSHDQPSRDSCLTTSLSVTNDNNKEYWNNSESKDVNSQELFSLFQHATPKHGSIISGNTDSGVSTSTPRTLPHRYDDNIRLLLEIAAERAFINNHLKEFGYSPIQFQLYNDFNELNIFLKYLIDKIDIN